MIGGVTEVVDTYEDRDYEIFCDKVCNICGKWKVAALVIADELSVNVHAADLIYSSKMQKKPLTFCIQAGSLATGWYGNTIRFIWQKLALYLGKRRFR